MPATDDYLRSPKSMHQVFCASAVLLLAVTLWMMWADYNDEWRTFQRNAFAFQAKRDMSREERIKTDPTFKQNVADLSAKFEAATKALDEHKAELEEVTKKALAAKIKADNHMRDLKLRRAERDVARADYNIGVRDSVPNLKDLEDNFATKEGNVKVKEAEFVQLAYESEQAKAEVARVTANRDAAKADLATAELDVT